MTLQPVIQREALRACRLCPRDCGADRLGGTMGFCRTGGAISIASICRHRGEEPPIAGPDGICNVFFTGCNLHCVYCQNDQISRGHPSSPTIVSLEEAAKRIGAHLASGLRAVGLVSPSHVLWQATQLMDRVERRGHTPTWVYNTNAYDRPERLAALSPRLDVYLPDLKYADDRLARAYSGVEDYVAVSRAALNEMFRQKGAALELDEQGRARSGLIIRHLVLPGQVENSKACLRFIARELSPAVHVSLMAQYHPTASVSGHPRLGRTLNPEEYQEVLDTLNNLGLENGWIQDLSSAGTYQPDFFRPHPFETEPRT